MIGNRLERAAVAMDSSSERIDLTSISKELEASTEGNHVLGRMSKSVSSKGITNGTAQRQLTGRLAALQRSQGQSVIQSEFLTQSVDIFRNLRFNTAGLRSRNSLSTILPCPDPNRSPVYAKSLA
jgi:hypothetical protein